MNKEICKALRKIARDSLQPGMPVAKLLAKPVKVMRGDKQVIVTIAVNAKDSERGRYLTLKKLYKTNPEARKKLDDTIAYLKVLRANPILGAAKSPFGEPDAA